MGKLTVRLISARGLPEGNWTWWNSVYSASESGVQNFISKLNISIKVINYMHKLTIIFQTRVL